MFNIGQINTLPVSACLVQRVTQRDAILSKVYFYIKNGWPAKVDKEIQPYFLLKEELSIEGNCVLRGIRVVVPKKLQKQVLEELHATHPGMQRMKLVARSFVWWPQIDNDIEALTRSCQSCKRAKQGPPKAPLQPWIWPSKPWTQLHIDLGVLSRVVIF